MPENSPELRGNAAPKSSSADALYDLKAPVPFFKALPFGMQHILAMFVSNITPILLIAGTAGLPGVQKTQLVQCGMLVAAVGTFFQLFPVMRFGSGLPIVMGTSFTFVPVFTVICLKYNLGTALGAALVGGLIEAALGLFVKFYRRFIPPVVTSTVVLAIGFSLLEVGANSFCGGYGVPEQGEPKFMIIGAVTLGSCILFSLFLKSVYRQLSVLFAMLVGYATALAFGVIDFSPIADVSAVSVPEFLPFPLEFRFDAILMMSVIFLVSAAETTGDASALSVIAQKREANSREIGGAILVDGLISSASALFGCMPITSYSQNIGLVSMTGVINRFAIFSGVIVMFAAGLFPPIAAAIATLPESVLGGCTIIMFGSIMMCGVKMLANCGFSERNLMIASLSVSIGFGFTSCPAIFKYSPQLLNSVFQNNCVAGAFAVAVILNLLIPKNPETKKHA